MKRTVLLIILAGWILIPTGTPDDILTFTLIKWFGPQMYALVILGLLLLMWHYKINIAKIKKAMKQVTKKWF